MGRRGPLRGRRRRADAAGRPGGQRGARRASARRGRGGAAPSSTRAREMAEGFCAPALLANARYEGKYPLVSALSRPVIVRHLVDEARRVGADAVAHGCTGKGNDQVRFEVGRARARAGPRGARARRGSGG